MVSLIAAYIFVLTTDSPLEAGLLGETVADTELGERSAKKISDRLQGASAGKVSALRAIDAAST